MSRESVREMASRLAEQQGQNAARRTPEQQHPNVVRRMTEHSIREPNVEGNVNPNIDDTTVEQISDEKVEGSVVNAPDCSFNVGTNYTKLFSCHKATLSNTSELFAKLLSGGFKESTNSYNIPFPSVEPDLFEKFLHYLYGGFDLLKFYSVTTLQRLIRFGDMILCNSLVENCVQVLMSKLSNSNEQVYYEALPIFEFASSYGMEELTHKTKKFLGYVDHSITSNLYVSRPEIFFEVVKTKKGLFNDIELFNIINHYVVVNKLVDKPQLDCAVFSRNSNKSGTATPSNVSEINAEQQKHESLLRDLLKLVDFYKFRPEEFTKYVYNSDLLSANDKLDVLATLCLKKKP